MNYLKIRKLLCIALLGATSIFGMQPHVGLASQRNVAVKHSGVINPAYTTPILVSFVPGPIKTALDNVLANTETRLHKQNIGFKKQSPLHVSFFYFTQLPSQQDLATIEQIVKEAMLALKSQDISFTVVPELDLMGKATTFVVVRLRPSQGAINFFNYVQAELIKAGIPHVQYPNFEAHISLGKITTPGITPQHLAQVIQKGTDDLEKIPVAQLPFTVSSCMLTQNLTKQPVVSFEFQQATIPVPVAVQNIANKKPAAAAAKAAQKVAPRAVAPRAVAPRVVAPQVKVAAKKAVVAKQQPKVQPKAVQKVAPKAKVAVKNAPKRPVVKQQPKVQPKKAVQKVAPRAVAPQAKKAVVKQQPKVQPKAVQKVQPKAVQKVAPRAVAPQAKVAAKNAPKRPVIKQQPKMIKKPLKK